MNFEPTEEQSLLRATLNQFLAQQYDFGARTSASRCTPGYRPEMWRAFAEQLGLLGVCVAVEQGGLGGGAVEQMIVMEELGRALVLEPIAETLFQCGWLLQKCEMAGFFPALVAGDVRMALATCEPGMRDDLTDISAVAARSGSGWSLTGHKAVVMAAPWATHLIVAARTSGSAGDASGLSLFLMPAKAKGLAIHDYPTIDGRRAADLIFDHVAIGPDALLGGEGDALDLLEAVRDRAIAAQAAEAAGVLDRLLLETIAYCKQRQQFGQHIASFQALQHRMVDMHIHVEMTRSAAVLAGLRLDGDPVARALAASAAKVTVANACRFVGQNAVQLHGGMGMTDELAIGHYFKRATVIENEFGSAGWHLARHATLSLAQA